MNNENQHDSELLTSLLSDPNRKKFVQDIIAQVVAERAFQIKNWGDEFESACTPNDWTALISKYIGQSVLYPWDHKQFEIAMVKISALCFAAIEQSYKKSGVLPKRHYDE